jgi:hypothetical protein
MTQGSEPATQWLKVTEAAPRLGLTLDGLRSRIKRGQVTTRRGNDGRLLVSVALNGADHSHDQSRELSPNSSGTVRELSYEPAPNGSAEPDHDLLSDLLDARERAARAEGELAGLREALVGEARRSADLLASLELERARADAALAAERSRGDRLAAELALARKGWLERLLEAVRRR